MPRRSVPIDEISQRMRGAFVQGEPAGWQSGSAEWSGTIDLEPLAADTGHVTGIVSPARTRIRITGSHGCPSIEAIVEVRQGYPELISITISNTATGGLVTSDLRNVSVAQLVENVVMRTAERSTQVGEGVWSNDAITEDDAKAVKNARRRSRRRPGDARRTRRAPDALQSEIVRAADIYRENFGGGRPQQAVREKLGLTERTAARRIQQARKAELLPETKKGTAKA